jgi:hypothetical protein
MSGEQDVIPMHHDSDTVARWIWKNLIPKAGQSEWVQGELIRCIEKLCWEAQNNGNGNWEPQFEMLADYLEETLCGEPTFSDEARNSIHEDMAVLKDFMHPYTDQDLYDRLTSHVVAFCRQHPTPIPKPRNPELKR